MAKTPTQNQTSAPASQQVRSRVNSLISAELGGQRNPAIQELKSLSGNDRSLSIISAAAAVYRSTKDPSFKPSTEQIKRFHAAATLFAHKKGIKPEKDGSFNDALYEKELSPLEILKDQTLETFKESENNAFSEAAISKSIADAYSDSANKDQEVEKVKQDLKLQELSKIEFLNDKDFLDLSEDAQKNYISKLADCGYIDEQKRLQEKIKNFDPSQKAGEFSGFDEDPDWGHKDDDKFKIEQGDIIEYLMKEIILASAAWAGNKVAGFAGVVAYESLHSFHYGITVPAARATIKHLTKKWENFFSKDTDDSSDEAQNLMNQRQTDFNSAIETNSAVYEHFTSDTAAALFSSESPARRAIDHSCLFEDRGIITSNEDGTTTQTPYPPNTTQQDFIALQKNFDTFHLAMMNQELNPDNNPDKSKKIEDYFNKVIENRRSAVTNGQEKPALPDTPKDFNKAFVNSENLVKNHFLHLPYYKSIEAQHNLFCEYFCQHQYLELCRKDKDNPILHNEEKLTDYLISKKNEASKIFAGAFTNTDNSRNMSCQQLVDMAKEAYEKTEEKIKKKDFKSNTENPFAENAAKIKPDTKNFIDAMENTTLETFYNQHLADLNREEEYLNHRQSVDYPERINLVAEAKKRCEINSSSMTAQEKQTTVQKLNTPQGRTI